MRKVKPEDYYKYSDEELEKIIKRERINNKKLTRAKNEKKSDFYTIMWNIANEASHFD